MRGRKAGQEAMQNSKKVIIIGRSLTAIIEGICQPVTTWRPAVRV
jgi:hypothetical protein